ncbi:hypothetical protein [Paraburkholderia dilworthii]|uniref:Uncharacterized protein n=1 Tax=Paraburkholderia dilworthii TaxID=948106 RepID=A0ABW9DC40_9BURK
MTKNQLKSSTAAGRSTVSVAPLVGCDISAVSYEGLTVKTADGEPAMLAVVDANGNVIAVGPGVASEAWKVAIASYRNFLQGAGYLRVHSQPLAAI